MENSAKPSLSPSYVETPPFTPGSPLPFKEIYTYCETTSSQYVQENSAIHKSLTLLAKPFFFLQGILQCALISIDVGLHALFYNANKISKEIDSPQMEGRLLLEKITLLFKFLMKRITLSAKAYIIDHWIFQKDVTADLVKERENEPPLPNERVEQIDGISTLFIGKTEYTDYILYIPGMRDSHQVSNHHLHNMSTYLKANIVCPNPMGVGGSIGACTGEQAYYKAGITAFNYLITNQGISVDQITVWGHSLGGASAVNIAEKWGVKVVLDRTFSSLYDATENFPYAPFPCNKLIAKIANWALPLSIRESINGIDSNKLLVISSKNDNVIDFNKASAKNLPGIFQRMFCTFTDVNTDPAERLSLSHSSAHTPETLTAIKTLFIDK